MGTRLCPPLFLTGLVLLFFSPLVLHPAGVLYSDYSDLLAIFIPSKIFWVQSYQATGEMPLWCPYGFAGSPFVQDIQQGVFYPPHWPMLKLSTEHVGTFMSWLVVGHVWLAGMGMFLYGQRHGLGAIASIIAAIGYVFAGKWMSHLLIGGQTITLGLAWLPFILLCLEAAIQRGSFWAATLAGVIFALLLLCMHPQWTFYSGLFIAGWTLAEVLYPTTNCAEPPPRKLRLLRWGGFGAWTAIVAAGLTAVQLLPTLEAAGLSIRSAGLDPGQAQSQSLLPLLLLVGPSLDAKPDPVALLWEERGSFTVLWLLTAALAPVLLRGRWRYWSCIALVLLFLASAGTIITQQLPGFRSFRQHSRILLLAVFPVALLAAAATERIYLGATQDLAVWKKCRPVVRLVLLICLTLIGGLAVRMILTEQRWPAMHIYWISLIITLPVALWLIRPGYTLPLRLQPLVWCAILLADLWALAWPWMDVRHQAEIFAPSACVQFLAEHQEGYHRTLDRDFEHKEGNKTEVYAGPLGAGAPLAYIMQLPVVRGYNPLDVLRYKEYLRFISGSETPLRAFDKSGFTFPVIRDFRMEVQSLVNLLGVRYLVQPSSSPLDQPDWIKVFEDAHPWCYDVEQGIVALPPFTIYQNPHVLPRAFIVHQAEPLPANNVLAKLQQTDFRRTVLLEDWSAAVDPPNDKPTADTQEQTRTVLFKSYTPNRVELHVSDGQPGYLVLTDVWYPGWECKVAGQQTRVYRANYVFRAVEIPAREQTVIFSFVPRSLSVGCQITLITFALVVLVGLISIVLHLRRQTKAHPTPGAAST